VTTDACTSISARCADARKYDVELRPCCRGHILYLLRAVLGAFENARIPFWADYGTLLGAVRHGGLIPWDKDADIGVAWPHWNAVLRLEATFRSRFGFDVLVRPVSGSIKLRLSRVNHTNLDIFFWRTRPDGVMYRNRYAKVDAFKGREFSSDLLYPLGSVQFEGLQLPAPVDPDAFLSMRYGAWRTPVRANNKHNPPTIVSQLAVGAAL
jgi:fukutin-related protein